MGAGSSRDSSSSSVGSALRRLAKQASFASSGSSSFHCVMVGLDSAGKSTLLYRLKLGQYVSTTPTIGFNCEKIRFEDCSFSFWDVGGQDNLRPLWRSYLRGTNAVVFVVDSSREDRMEEAKLELIRFCGGAGNKPSASTPPPPVLVLANKQDLPRAARPDRVESLLGLSELPPATEWRVAPVCAVTGEGVEEAMEALTDMIAGAKRRKKGGSSSTNLSKGGNSSKRLSQHSKGKTS